MSAANRKAAPAPDMGGLTDDWQRLTSLRRSENGQEEKQAPPPTPKTSPVPAPQRETDADSGPEMTRRSWYANAAVVEELARVVDDIHHATRVPKNEVVSELFRAAVAAGPKVEKKLSKRR